MPSTIESNNKKRKSTDCASADLKQKVKDLERELADTTKKLEKANEIIAALRSKSARTNNDEPDEESDDESAADSTDPWSNMFKELREYRKINGHCKVPQKGSNPKLGKWVANQKQAYKNVKTGKKGLKIPQERINKLDGIDFYWGKAFAPPASWNEQFEELEKFKKIMGHCNITINPTNPSPIAKWVSIQRNEYKRLNKGRDSLLSFDQIEKLNGIGFNWKGSRLP